MMLHLADTKMQDQSQSCRPLIRHATPTQQRSNTCCQPDDTPASAMRHRRENNSTIHGIDIKQHTIRIAGRKSAPCCRGRFTYQQCVCARGVENSCVSLRRGSVRSAPAFRKSVRRDICNSQASQHPRREDSESSVQADGELQCKEHWSRAGLSGGSGPPNEPAITEHPYADRRGNAFS